jgi:hypothetical protein
MTARQLHRATSPWGQSATALLDALAVQVHALKWQQRGLCNELDPELFFADQEAAWSTAEARRACGMCPVKKQCLEWALTFDSEDDRHGILGGVGVAKRARMRTERNREVAA